MGPSTDSRPTLDYRPELDAVRGVAVLIVLFQHFVVDVEMPGSNLAGRVGVTIFFVLSGYLITRLLAVELEQTGRIALRGFFMRRVRRLVPALLVMVALVSAAGVPGNPLPALTYTTNWWVTLGGIGDIGAFHHTWTLGIELQFYALWAVAFGILARYPRPFVWAVLGILAVFAALALPWTGSIQRADALLAGALLAVTGAVFPAWVAIPGWAAIAILSLTSAVADTGLLVLATIASVAVVASPSPIAWRPLVRLGAMSYGVYLWSLPVRNVLLNVFPPNASWIPVWYFSGIALTVGIAAVSAKWIERPWRLRRAVGRVDVYQSIPAEAPQVLAAATTP